MHDARGASVTWAPSPAPTVRLRPVLLLALGLAAGVAGAQGVPEAPPEPPPAPSLGSSPRLYGGPALGPGVFGAYVQPRLLVLTAEAAVYADYDAGVLDNQRVLLGASLGGSVRLLQVAEIVADVDARQLDLDVGVRVGPAFYLAFSEQDADGRARAFSVLFDPFVRGQARLPGNRVVFAEAGLHAPALRAGLSLALGG